MTSTDTQPSSIDLASEAYAEIAVNRRHILSGIRPDGPRDMRSLLLRGERQPISRRSRAERNKIAKDGMFTYLGDSPLKGHEWWSTPSGEPVVLSTKRIEAILDGNDDGGVPAGILAEFKDQMDERLDEFVTKEPVPEEEIIVTFTTDIDADEGQEDEHGIRPTSYETEARSEVIDIAALREAEGQQVPDLTWPDGTKRVRIEADTPDAAPEDQDARRPYSDDLGVKDLADGVERVTGFLEVLRDPATGHKAVAEMFPFTSETSVRRWRKTNGVVLS